MSHSNMTTREKHRLILVLCVTLAVAALVYSVWVTHDSADAVRGGTLALGLTLAFVVGKSDTAAQVYLRLRQPPPGVAPVTAASPIPDRIAALEQRLADLESMLQSAADDEKILNTYLLAATIVGTLFAAFGDSVSLFLMHQLHITAIR